MYVRMLRAYRTNKEEKAHCLNDYILLTLQKSYPEMYDFVVSRIEEEDMANVLCDVSSRESSPV